MTTTLQEQTVTLTNTDVMRHIHKNLEEMRSKLPEIRADLDRLEAAMQYGAVDWSEVHAALGDVRFGVVGESKLAAQCWALNQLIVQKINGGTA